MNRNKPPSGPAAPAPIPTGPAAPAPIPTGPAAPAPTGAGHHGRPLLEVIALDAEDARAAESGGADRLELVAAMDRDGLTPTVAAFTAVRAATSLPVRVMLRARDGFGIGDRQHQEELCGRARKLRAAGAEEFVLGFLDAAGAPDSGALQALLAELDGCAWTFHRALDHTGDRHALRTALDGLPGLDTFLTAGAPTGVTDGLPVLMAEAARRGERGYRPRLLAGGGLNPDHLPLLRAAGVDAFHIGSAVRPGGWSGPVSAPAVARWRSTLDP